MGNRRFRNQNRIVQGSITLVLFLALFTMMSFTAFAQDQKGPSTRLQPISSLQGQPSGKAELTWNAQQQVLTATLSLSGLQPGSIHAAHIHAGTCASRGHILYPFINIVANAAGNAVSVTTIHNIASGIPATGWNITVHKGATAQTGDLLCGDVVNPTRAASISVPLHEG